MQEVKLFTYKGRRVDSGEWVIGRTLLFNGSNYYIVDTYDVNYDYYLDEPCFEIDRDTLEVITHTIPNKGV